MGELAFLSGFSSLYVIILSISSFIGIALFIITGLAYYKMSKGVGFKKAWLGFIPVVSVYALGRIAGTYVKKDGSKSAKFGPVLLVLNVLKYIGVAVFLVFAVISAISIIGNAEYAVSQDIAMELDMFMSLVPVIISYFVLFAISIAFSICFYVSLWRVYSLYDNKNAVLFTVLSIFFDFLTPIFLIIISKNQAKFTFEQRMGIKNE